METIKIIKKRNHYIPKTYLEKFLNKDNELYVYKKGEEFFNDKLNKNDRLLVIKGKEGLEAVGVKNKLYIPEGKFEGDKNVVEDFFSEKFEGPYNKFIEFVENNFYDIKIILQEYYEYIITLTASMMVRTLHYKLDLDEMYKAYFQTAAKFRLEKKNSIVELQQLLKDEFAELNDAEIEKHANDYIKMINDGAFSVKLPKNLFIKQMIESLKFHSTLISDMTIQIVKNNSNSFFITSDNPVVYFVPKGKENLYYGPKSLGGHHTEIFFPLTKDLCLILSRKQMEVFSGIPLKHYDKKIIKIINNAITHHSRDFIYSPYQASFLDKYIETKIPYPFKLSNH